MIFTTYSYIRICWCLSVAPLELSRMFTQLTPWPPRTHPIPFSPARGCELNNYHLHFASAREPIVERIIGFEVSDKVFHLLLSWLAFLVQSFFRLGFLERTPIRPLLRRRAHSRVQDCALLVFFGAVAVESPEFRTELVLGLDAAASRLRRDFDCV